MLNPHELLCVVDENDQPLEPKTREEVHQKGDWHRVSHVWICNNAGEVLCQRRSAQKDKNPGKWEPYFGGHLGPEITYLAGALSEVNEELSLPLSAALLHFAFVYKNADAREFQGIFFTQWDGDTRALQLETDEVAEVRWIPITTLMHDLASQGTDWVDFGYQTAILAHLSHLTTDQIS